jgi:isoamyl acetate esterase
VLCIVHKLPSYRPCGRQSGVQGPPERTRQLPSRPGSSDLTAPKRRAGGAREGRPLSPTIFSAGSQPPFRIEFGRQRPPPNKCIFPPPLAGQPLARFPGSARAWRRLPHDPAAAHGPSEIVVAGKMSVERDDAPPAPSPSPAVPIIDGDDLPAGPDDFLPPPVMDGIGAETSMGERLTTSLAELQTRVSSIMHDSSTQVTRAIKSAVPPAAIRRTSPYPMIIAFGDSITERGSQIWPSDHECGRGVGWIAHLSSMFHARADVVARGFSGYNTRLALHLLPRVLAGLEENATVMLIWFGANDSVVGGRGGQHVSVEEYGLHMAKMVFEVMRANALPVLVTPPPLHQETADADGEGSAGKRVNENTARYAKACVEIAKKMDVPCIDVYTGLTLHAKTQDGLKAFLSDGLHLSGAGNAFVATVIYRELQSQVPSLSDERLRRWFPPFGDIDMSNPASALPS